ncbi:opine metallophore biosynthesis dehydrogenase, partial [Staphylococcus epidermidis]|uniref:opine metallophore biosynthesis dehydrogenase n=1 Tax=Staphylococcus epidermidis TaxID=1282 RepID=UPI00119FE800
LPSLNLLNFIVKQNYPIPHDTIPQLHIQTFQNLSPIHQHYLLYLPYTPILIHPFSNPDHQGPYFHFSTVPYK